LPSYLVEIDRQEEARFILEHRINADDHRSTIGILAGKMLANDLVGDWQELPMGARRKPDFRLLTHASRPFVRAGRRLPNPGRPKMMSKW
jgi:hypothetical protein